MQKLKIALILLVLALTSCGYSFRGSESVLPPDIKVVYLPVVENSSPQQGLSILLTESLRDEFERYGAVSISDTLAGSDAVLSARIIDVRRETETVTSGTDTALQLATIISISAELRRDSGILLWSNPLMIISKSFGAESDVVITSSPEFAGGGLGSGDLAGLDSLEVSRGQEQQALEDIVEEVARRVYEEAVLPDF